MIRKIFLGIGLLLAGYYGYRAVSPPVEFFPKQEASALGKIFLLGETHNDELCLKKEIKYWKHCYDTYGFRHLFMEESYATAQFLNLWMQAENDEILNQLEQDRECAHLDSFGPNVIKFFKTIKDSCPQTIFHGTDVAHLFKSTDQRYLDYLEAQGQRDSEAYQRTQENIEQGKCIYINNGFDWDTREFMMVQNFIREFDALGGLGTMGIYGSAHLYRECFQKITIPRMIEQLIEHYGRIVRGKFAGD
ncbi:MAG: hypothetical protein K2L24_00265 [Opitutales bacterium]|nr:hypothetical protein [Opitutales bacterium]